MLWASTYAAQGSKLAEEKDTAAGGGKKFTDAPKAILFSLSLTLSSLNSRGHMITRHDSAWIR